MFMVLLAAIDLSGALLQTLPLKTWKEAANLLQSGKIISFRTNLE